MQPSTASDPESAGDGASQRREAPPGHPGPARRAAALLRRGLAAAAGLWRAFVAVVRRVHERAPWLRIGLFALAGAALAVALFGRVPAKVGPFETTVSVRPALTGHTVVHLAPLGTIDLDTQDWPVALDLTVDEISVADAERIAENPGEIETLGDEAPDQVRAALNDLAIRSAIVALLGGVAGALVARLSWIAALGGAAVGALLVAALGVGSWVTFRESAVAEPRYSGLLTRAPAAVGDIDAVLDRFGEYRGQLSELVDNMATLYLAGSELPVFETDSRLIRVLHVSDIHLNPQAFDLSERLIEQFSIDAVVDTGDLTDWGTDPEAQLVSRIGGLDVPYVYVRGNHDSTNTQQAVASQPNAVVLDGDGATVAGLRFWGIGDPRYTPDKSQQAEGSEQERAEAFAPEVAEGLRADEPPPVDVALVHDRRMAEDLGGLVPLVLAGHGHEPDEAIIAPIDPDDEDAEDDGSDTSDADDADNSTTTTTTTTTTSASGDGSTSATGDEPEETLLLVEGSTGGAGLRGLQGDEPEPLTASILYFDPDTRRLVAYDRLSVAWLENAGATIQRHIIGQDPDPATEE